MATLILGVVGAGVGYAVGGPAGAWKGFQVGAAVGSYVDAQNSIPKTDTGRATDLRFGGSSYASTLPRVWGAGRVAGMVFWCKEDSAGRVLVEHEKESSRGGGSGGGGGGSSYSYTATFQVAFCQQTWYARDPQNLTGGQLISRPVALKKLWADDQLVYDSSNPSGSKWKLNEDFYFYPGTETQNPDSRIAASYGGASHANATRGIAHIVTDDVEVEGRIPNVQAELETVDPVSLADLVSDQARGTGILATDLDVSAGASTWITGFIQMNRAAPQQDLDALLAFYGFDMPEIDGVLKLVKRDGPAVATIPAADLGAAVDGYAPRMKRRRILRSELPGAVEVQYFDKGLSFQNGNQRAIYRAADTYQAHTVSGPFVLTAAEAAKGANRILDTIWNEVEALDFSLPMRWFRLAPSNPIMVPINGVNRRVRIVSMDIAPGVLMVSAVTDGENTSVQEIEGATGDGGTQPLTEVVPSIFVVWSGAEIRNEDQNTPGFYVAGNGADGWRGGTVWYSGDGGTNWIQGGYVSARSIWGVTTSILSDSGAVANEFDTLNTVGVDISATGGVLNTTADQNVRAGENHFLIGGEIVGVANVNLTGPNAYTLSRLRRGERGTAMNGHASGDVFVQLSPGLTRVSVSESLVGETVQVKVVSPGQTLADVAPANVVIAARTPTQSEAIMGAVLVPQFIAPVTLAESSGPVAEMGGNNLLVDWTTANLASYVPGNARMAIVQWQMGDHGDQTGPRIMEARPTSSGPSVLIGLGQIEVDDADFGNGGQAMVPLDDSAPQFDWRITGKTMEVYKLELVGYWSPMA